MFLWQVGGWGALLPTQTLLGPPLQSPGTQGPGRRRERVTALTGEAVCHQMAAWLGGVLGFSKSWWEERVCRGPRSRGV